MAKKEEYIAICRKHWTVYIKEAIFALCCFAISIATFLDMDPNLDMDSGTNKGIIVFAISLFALAVLTVLHMVLYHRFTYVALTKTALISRVFSIRHYERLTIPLVHILGVGTSTGILGSIFDCRTITIKCLGALDERYDFDRMAKARQFVRQVPTNPILRNR